MPILKMGLNYPLVLIPFAALVVATEELKSWEFIRTFF
jgi:hypothetical protein